MNFGNFHRLLFIFLSAKIENSRPYLRIIYVLERGMAARGVYIPARDFGPHHAVMGECRYGNSLTKGGNQRPLDHKRRKP